MYVKIWYVFKKSLTKSRQFNQGFIDPLFVLIWKAKISKSFLITPKI